MEASEHRTPPAGGPVDEISQMQKLVTELNQIAAERDALSQELRRSHAPKARSWCGNGPPDLSNIPPLPDDHQAIEEWMNARNCNLRDALEFGSADVISQVSNMLAQGASKLSTLSRVSAVALQGQAMDVQTSLGNRMCAVMQQTPSGGVSTREGVRVGEAVHPGPARRILHRATSRVVLMSHGVPV